MKTFTLLALLAAGPVAAWEFTPVPICTLSAPTEKGEVRVTYDPAKTLYEIRLTFAADLGELTWEDAEYFVIEFIGPRSLTISTDRHSISDDGKSLFAQDSGFGNVLDGLEFNSIAQASAGSSTMVMSLAGAKEPVRAFRKCGTAALS